jgi:hypothetical protein
MSDAKKLKFTVRVRKVPYGDNRTFCEFRIFAWLKGHAAGVWDGPTRKTITMDACRAAGWAMVRTLRTHRLYAIDVTKKDIDNGEARSCQSCAISQALWREQERMGFPRLDFDFRVEPYGFMADCGGIILNEYHGEEIMTGEHGMPDLVFQSPRGPYLNLMAEWAQEWDEWADSRHMSLSEWREELGKESNDRPYRPSSCSFVLDVTAMQEVTAALAAEGKAP